MLIYIYIIFRTIEEMGFSSRRAALVRLASCPRRRLIITRLVVPMCAYKFNRQKHAVFSGSFLFTAFFSAICDMKAVAVEESRHVRGAEDISLLHLLHPVPEQPSANTLLDLDQRNDAYILSAKQELRLASSIAFLSSITDNRYHITAVCIQERREQDRIDILLAINKKKFEDGNAILTEICDALFGIFKRLSRPIEGML